MPAPDHPPPLAHPARLILILSLAPTVGLGIGRFAYSLVLPDMRDALGWSYSAAGFMNTINAAGYLAGALVASKLIKRFGFRTVIVWSNAIGAAILVLMALVDASTPIVVTIVLLIASGAFRSIGFSGYNTIQFVDVPPALTNGANTLSSTMQQVAAGLGIAVAALLVRLGGQLAVSVTHDGSSLGYRWAFIGAAALLLIPLFEALALPRHAGSLATAR